MSAANAQFSLPPGDRDDVPNPLDLAPPQPEPGAHDPGRKPELPTLVVIRNWMEQQQLALADVVIAEKQGDLALLEAATMRLAEACMPNMLRMAHQLKKEIVKARMGARQLEHA